MMMALPDIRIRFTADDGQATAAANRVNDALKRTEAAAAAATTRARGLTGAMGTGATSAGAYRSSIQNAAFQIGDFAVQVSAGTAASRALAMQLPQLLGAFGVFGAVAGAAAAVLIPLASRFFDTGQAASSFDEAMKSINATTSSFEGAVAVLSASMDQLIAKYGEAAERVRNLAVLEANLAAAEAARTLAEEISTADEALRDYTETSNSAFRSGTTLANAIRNLQRDFGITSAEGRELEGILRDIRDAADYEAQVESLQRMATFMEQVGLEADKIPGPLARALQEVINISRETDAAAQAMRNLAAAAAGMNTGVPLDPNRPDLLPPTSAPTETSRRGGGGGRSGGGAASSPYAGRIEALVSSLQTERETADAWYAEGLDLLAKANEAELAAIGGHNEAKLRLEDEYQKRLASVRDAGSKFGLAQYLDGAGAVLGAMGAFNDKALKVSQAFAAAEALVSTYQGAAAELRKGTLGFGTAALVIARGLAFVAAIKGVNAKSGGAGGAASPGGGGAVAAAAPRTATPQPVVDIVLHGSPLERMFWEMIKPQLVPAFNEAVRNGARPIFR